MFPIKLASANVAVLVLGSFLTDSSVAAGTCETWDAEYTLAANLTLKDTPMGEGDGTYTIGPGKVVLRFTTEGNRTSVKMMAYSMREQFVIKSKTLL